jgi:hypothetical protein
MSIGKFTDIWEALASPFSGTVYTSATVYKLTQHHKPEGLYPCKYSSLPLLKPQISCLFDILKDFGYYNAYNVSFISLGWRSITFMQFKTYQQPSKLTQVVKH